MRIIQPHEQAPEPGTYNVLIFGAPGVGKTTFATSGKNPLLIAFDAKGAKRALNAPAQLQLDSWQDAIELAHQDNRDQLRDFDTIVIDTADRALDMLAAHIISSNASYVNRAGGLTLQGYGALKSMFSTWVKQLNLLGVHLIFVCHSKTTEQNGGIYHKPDITGGSYDYLLQETDLAGYIDIDNGKRFIDFSPAEWHVGKDFAQLGRQILADKVMGGDKGLDSILEVFEACDKVLQSTRQKVDERETALMSWQDALDNLQGAPDDQVAALDKLARDFPPEFCAEIERMGIERVKPAVQMLNSKDLELFNKLLTSIQNAQNLSKEAVLSLKHLLDDHRKLCELTFDKSTKQFSNA